MKKLLIIAAVIAAGSLAKASCIDLNGKYKMELSKDEFGTFFINQVNCTEITTGDELQSSPSISFNGVRNKTKDGDYILGVVNDEKAVLTFTTPMSASRTDFHGNVFRASKIVLTMEFNADKKLKLSLTGYVKGKVVKQDQTLGERIN